MHVQTLNSAYLAIMTFAHSENLIECFCWRSAHCFPACLGGVGAFETLITIRTLKCHWCTYYIWNIWTSFVPSSLLFHIIGAFECQATLISLFSLGCKGAQVEEIWSMEPENFENLK